MPRATVNGVSIAYEIFGQGPPVVWTPGGWFPRIGRAYLNAGRLSIRRQIFLIKQNNSDIMYIDITD